MDDLLTVMFTSGSTGQPKGVMLTHRNVGSNVEAIDAIVHLTKDDVLLGVLPMFHSFGYTATLWTAMTLSPKAVYHYTPLEPRQIGKLCRQHGTTILVATPTFLRSYLRRCEPEEFAKLDVVFTGAEKLPADLAEAFEKRFGVRPVEGYGATELSPVVSGNIPPSRDLQRPARLAARDRGPAAARRLREGRRSRHRRGPRRRPAGLLLVDRAERDEGLPRSPRSDRPGPPRRLVRDRRRGAIDADGFIHITDRLSRFSKIGGEMVPHIRIEEAIRETAAPRRGRRAAIGGRRRARREEGRAAGRLAHRLAVGPEELCRRLAQSGLPPLWIPSPDSFRQVEAIPVLGTGKLDLRRMEGLRGGVRRPARLVNFRRSYCRLPQTRLRFGTPCYGQVSQVML